MLRILTDIKPWYADEIVDTFIKKNVELNAFTRAAPAIQCESQEKLAEIRQLGIDATSDAVDLANTRLRTSCVLIIIVCMIFFAWTIVFACLFEADPKVTLTFSFCCQLLMIGFTIGILLSTSGAMSASSDAQVRVETVFGNWECGDPISRVVGETIYSEIKGAYAD